MRLIRRLFIAAFALLALFALAAGVYGKPWAENQIFELLDDEAKKACDTCHFEFDSFSLSPWSVTGVARNVRLVRHGKTALSFQEVRASSSLRELRDRIIPLQLELIDGHATGVGEDSATYRFIDSLTAPIPPEQDRPGRLKVRLDHLSIRSTSFVEDFSGSRVVANGIALEVIHQPDGFFRLEPSIEEVAFEYPRPSFESRFSLGKVNGALIIKDDHVEFEKIHTALARSFLDATGKSLTKEGNTLQGDTKFHIDAADAHASSYCSGAIDGAGELTGTLGNPGIRGQVQSTASGIQILSLPSNPIHHLGGKLFASPNRGSAMVDVTEISGEGEGYTINHPSEFHLRDETLSGDFSLSIPEFIHDSFVAKGTALRIRLSGTIPHPIVDIDSESPDTSLKGYSLGSLTAHTRWQGKELPVEFTFHQGKGTLGGKLIVTEEGDIHDLHYQATEYQVFPPDPNEVVPFLRINGEGTGEGPASLASIHASTSLQIHSEAPLPEIDVQGDASLHEGVLAVQGKEQNFAIDFRSTIPLTSQELSKLHIETASLHIPNAGECIDAVLSGDYSFSLDQSLSGNGTLSIPRLKLGCAPYQFSLQNGKTIQIRKGSLIADKLLFQGPYTAVSVSGDISLVKGLNLTADGDVNLASFSSYIPQVDDLGGVLGLSISAVGPFSQPVLSGWAKLSEGQVSSEIAKININALSGEAKLNGSEVLLEHIVGEMNSGSITGQGRILLTNFNESSADFKLSNVIVEPEPNVYAVTEGNLSLRQGENSLPRIDGNIIITNAQIEKSIDLQSVLRLLSGLLRPAAKERITGNSSASAELHVQLSAPRNIQIVTNWLEAELKGSVLVTGNASAPSLEGTLETLYGWFGLKDRRFEITSGTVTFQPGNMIPTLDILGESTVPTATGENITILLEARGVLTNPKITLSSDRGLSQREILTLLTSTSEVTSTTDVKSLGFGLNYKNFSLLQQDSLPGVGTFLYKITKIDSLSLEPSYNTLTGAIEPAVIAQKNFSERLSLTGEGHFGSTTSQSKGSVTYELTDRVSVSGGVQSLGAENPISFGADLSLTLLAPQKQAWTIDLTGNRKFSRKQVFSFVRLSENLPLAPSELPSLTERLEEAYRNRGYFEVKVTAQCQEGAKPCEYLKLHIHEGPPSRVHAIQIQAEEVESLFTKKDLHRLRRRSLATTEFLDKAVSVILEKLRREGYIGARVQARYQSIEKSNQKDLIINITPGNQVRFIFQGNNRFSAEEFFRTINLFSRKQPFGSNSIAILIENMERLYREAGYLFATITYERQENPERRQVIFLVHIDEEKPVPVQKVYLSGNSTPVKDLRRTIRKMNRENDEAIFHPTFAIEEELSVNTQILTAAFTERGYPNASVQYELHPSAKGDYVEIEYHVAEGEQVIGEQLLITGLPLEIPSPEHSSPPYSSTVANRFMSEVEDALRSHGYVSGAAEVIYEPKERIFLIKVIPGEPTSIGAIRIEGNLTVDSKVILDQLTIKSGMAWNQEEIANSKRRLLKLGLFSKVTLEPESGSLTHPTEDLVVRVNERALQSLRIGSGANSEYGVHIFGEAVDKTLFADGRAFSFRSDLYYQPTTMEVSQGSADILFTDPQIFSSDFSLVEDLRFQKVATLNQEFDVVRSGLASYLYRSYEDGITTSFGHNFSSEDISNVSPGSILSPLDSGLINLSFLSGTTTYDGRDDPLNPRRGLALSTDYKWSGESIGSDANFYSVGSKLSFIAPLHFVSPRWSVAGSSRFGSSWLYGDTKAVPITQRFYLGGRNSIRGFRENSLGPRALNGDIIGGDILQANSLQLQYVVAQNTSLHTFLDSGNVFLRNSPYDITHQRISTGLGIQYQSPIGPIGIDIGHPLDEKSGEPSMRFHFSIGTNF